MPKPDVNVVNCKVDVDLADGNTNEEDDQPNVLSEHSVEEFDQKTMAGRLSSQIMGQNGVVRRTVTSSLCLSSCMGLPIGKHIVPDAPFKFCDSVNYELVWDNGTSFPEPCIDRIADTVGKHEALGWLCGGLVNYELVWDNGTSFPEPCIDRIADTVGKYEAFGWLCGGL
nr:NADH dehydrogenase [ubiquinone] 1 beta subcomplex subunit 8, mitochondrial [Tanacetum cinerariifolium]